ncbi:hypothetical protein LCGC14_0468380 [marine sediment metagenome]|uniref:Uncharacterized protein n=1 Tax=marine sediment metagenome TaxID=412755 RepID=A0A0F9SVS1_9ZZZZ
MRYASSFKQPTKVEQALIRRHVKALTKKFGNVRQAALHIGVNPKYMYSLARGEKVNPGDTVLRKLGLRRVTYIEER